MKEHSERKRILRLWRREKSGGKEVRPGLPDRSRCVRVWANLKISRGKVVREAFWILMLVVPRLNDGMLGSVCVMLVGLSSFDAENLKIGITLANSVFYNSETPNYPQMLRYMMKRGEDR